MSDMPKPDTPNPDINAPVARPLWKRLAGRMVGVGLIAAVFYLVLWFTVFNAVTSVLVASGTGIVLIVGGSASETFAGLLETIAEWIGAILSAIVEGILSVLSGLFD